MAKTASELNRKVLQNIRTQKTNLEIEASLSGITALGEIAVQMGSGDTTDESKLNTGLWTLAADGETPVRFPSEQRVQEMISGGAVAEVDKIEASVGLYEDGTIVSGDTSVWGENTNYFNSASTVVNAVSSLDENLAALSGYVSASDYELAHDDNKVVDSLKQVDGRLSGTSVNLTSVKLSGYTVGGDDSGKVAESDTLGQALGKLQGQINGMDKTADAKTGQIVTTVSETDGKVSETQEYLKNITLSGYSKQNNTGAIADTDSLEVALSKLENTVQANEISNTDGSITVTTGTTGTDIKVHIKDGEKVIKLDSNGNGLYTDLDLVKITTGLPEEVKERYQLLASDDSQIGANIDVYKDSHIVSITYITDSADTHYQNLEYVYIDASGVTQTTYVDMSELVIEAEFASGVTATNHIVHGVVDNTSEKDESDVDFLTVGANGFKVSGIKDAIDTKINKLDASVSAETTHITVQVDEVDGKLTAVTLSESDIASASALTAEINRATSAETQLDAVIGAVKGASEARTYGHSGTNYLDGNTTVKADVEKLDQLLGNEVSSPASSADTTFSSENTVAHEISGIKAKLEEYKNKLSLTAVDDDKYIATQVTTGDTGTTIGVSAITMAISASTSSSSALADSYDVKQFAVSAVKDNSSNGGSTRIAVVTEDDVKKLDVSNLTVDCGTF